jgi:hypothetical protein
VRKYRILLDIPGFAMLAPGVLSGYTLTGLSRRSLGADFWLGRRELRA